MYPYRRVRPDGAAQGTSGLLVIHFYIHVGGCISMISGNISNTMYYYKTGQGKLLSNIAETSEPAILQRGSKLLMTILQFVKFNH